MPPKASSSLLAGIQLMGWIFILLMFFAESIFYPGFIQLHMGINLAVLGALIVIAEWIFYWWSQPAWASVVSKFILKYVFPGLSLISVWLGLLEQTHFPNYVFSTFHLHPSMFAWLVLIVGVTGISLLPLKNWRLHVKQWLTWLPMYVALFLLPLAANHFSLFMQFGNEDSWVEYGTFGAFVVTAILSVKIIRELWQHHARDGISILLAGCILMGSILSAGEEISWGQRLLHLSVPAEFEEENVQQEINIHNLRIFMADDGFYYLQPITAIYLLISFYALVFWMISPKLQKLFPQFSQAIQLITPPQWVIGYFLPIFIYSLLRIFTGPLTYKVWEELAELYFAIGVVIFVGNFTFFSFQSKIQ